MKHKKVIIFFAFLIYISGAFCQKGFQNLKEYDYAQYHFGFLLGYSQMGYSIKLNKSELNTPFQANEIGGSPLQTVQLTSVEPIPAFGFTIGIIGNLRLSEHFDLRFIPDITFGAGRSIKYNYNIIFGAPSKDSISIKWKNSSLIAFPLNLKYKGNRINNARPYILGGIKYVLDSSPKVDETDGNLIADEVDVKLKASDLYFELGAGFDFYFDWFKMGLEAKMSYGSNLKVNNNSRYTKVIDRLNSKIFQLSITFE